MRIPEHPAVLIARVHFASHSHAYMNAVEQIRVKYYRGRF